jgi:hypothetical protein
MSKHILSGAASDNPGDVTLVLDRDAGTRWRSLRPRANGIWLDLDLGEYRKNKRPFSSKGTVLMDLGIVNHASLGPESGSFRAMNRPSVPNFG